MTDKEAMNVGAAPGHTMYSRPDTWIGFFDGLLQVFVTKNVAAFCIDNEPLNRTTPTAALEMLHRKFAVKPTEYWSDGAKVIYQIKASPRLGILLYVDNGNIVRINLDNPSVDLQKHSRRSSAADPVK